MIAQAASVDHRQNLVIDPHLANERDSWAGSGVNPWPPAVRASKELP
jgi:hypothetical protein